MDTNQRKQYQRDGDHVQGEETIERCIADYIIAADPERQVGANPWNRRKEIRDHLRAPVRHLSPRQQIAKKRLGHQAQKNHAAEYPDQFAARDRSRIKTHGKYGDRPRRKTSTRRLNGDNGATSPTAHRAGCARPRKKPAPRPACNSSPEKCRSRFESPAPAMRASRRNTRS